MAESLPATMTRVIIGHSQFEKIPMSIERQKATLQEQLDEIAAGIADAKSAKAERRW